jgi:hypothetical protein
MKIRLPVLGFLHANVETGGQTDRHGEANRHSFANLVTNSPINAHLSDKFTMHGFAQTACAYTD